LPKINSMIAVISGATRGIGRAMALAFASEGFNLALGARNEHELISFKKELESNFLGIHVLAEKVDFSIKEEVKEFAASVKRAGDPVEVIVNNVGIFYGGTVSNESEDLFEKHMSVNLNSAWYLTRALVKEMMERKSGYIFNICSITSKLPKSDAASYSVSKMAMYGFSKVLTEEMREHNIKVTAILPASVNTSSWNGINAPVNTFVQPEDVANAAITAYKNSTFAFTEEIILKPLDKRF
jgi:short-subunit dehydrogenase